MRWQLLLLLLLLVLLLLLLLLLLLVVVLMLLLLLVVLKLMLLFDGSLWINDVSIKKVYFLAFKHFFNYLLVFVKWSAVFVSCKYLP